MFPKEEFLKRLAKIKADNREYSKTELLTIIGKIYVDISKENKQTNLKILEELPKKPKDKRQPSKYNLFIAEQMIILQEKGIKSSIERMKIASEMWNKQKE
jgi:hypothetical protein